MPRDRPLTTDPLRRFLKIGGLAGRVGASVLSDKVRTKAGGERTEKERLDHLVRNAVRIVETLGELRGGAMKVGQMLSLHEALFPPEVAAVLSKLQQKAPSVPFEVIEYELRDAIPDFDELFESIEEDAFAAASIGQVHRALLRDGREVAVKIQYPLIDRVIEADLGNLKKLLQQLFALFTEMEFEPFWRELEARLREEIDYETEADTLRAARELHRNVDDVRIPKVVEEASGRRVLTMEYLPGIPPRDAASDHYPQELRDRWGANLFRFVVRGLFVHRELHADPNFANFAFREDGSLIVYDWGCFKRLPDPIAEGYRETVEAILEGRRDDVPAILHEMGITHDGDPLEVELVTDYIDLFDEIFDPHESYRFGVDASIYGRVFELGMSNLSKTRKMTAPEDIVFVDRAVSGHFGNLGKLRAAGRWRALLERALDGSLDTPGG